MELCESCRILYISRIPTYPHDPSINSPEQQPLVSTSSSNSLHIVLQPAHLQSTEVRWYWQAAYVLEVILVAIWDFSEDSIHCAVCTNVVPCCLEKRRNVFCAVWGIVNFITMVVRVFKKKVYSNPSENMLILIIWDLRFRTVNKW